MTKQIVSVCDVNESTPPLVIPALVSPSLSSEYENFCNMRIIIKNGVSDVDFISHVH